MRAARILIIGLVAACGACASIDRRAERVRVVSDEAAVSGCSFRGFVESRDGDGSRSSSEGGLRREAVRQGGNVVLSLSPARTSGEAYYCPALSLASNPASFVPAESFQRINPNAGPYCPPSID